MVDKNKNKILATSSMILEQERGIEVKKLNGCPKKFDQKTFEIWNICRNFIGIKCVLKFD